MGLFTQIETEELQRFDVKITIAHTNKVVKGYGWTIKHLDTIADAIDRGISVPLYNKGKVDFILNSSHIIAVERIKEDKNETTSS